MKTAEEFGRAIDDMVWEDELRAIEARDAEHRAELDQCQTDLKSARHSLSQSDNLVAGLVVENDRLKGELAEARNIVKECRDMMVIQTKRSTGEFHLSGEAFVPMWSDAITAATKFLAATPPSESTPVQRISMKETSWGGRYAVMQPSSTDPKQAACKTSGCGHPKEQHDFADDCTADDCTCAGFDPGDAPSPFGPCPTCSSPAAPPDDIRERLSEALEKRADYNDLHFVTLERRVRWMEEASDRKVTALEAKGEPGTHAKGEER